METQTGILTPLTGGLTIPPLPTNRIRALGVIVIMRNHSEVVIDFVRKLLITLRNIPAHKLELIIVDYHSEDDSFVKMQQLMQRLPSLHMMRANHRSGIAEAIFRAWQRSHASIVGTVEMGDYAALGALQTMLSKIESDSVDAAVGYRYISPKQYIAPTTEIGMLMAAHACARLIMPDLFASSMHPLSTTLFVKRDILVGREMRMYGSALLPNVTTQIPTMRIAETPYPYQPVVARNKLPLLSLRTLIPVLFKLNLVHKTHIAEEG